MVTRERKPLLEVDDVTVRFTVKRGLLGGGSYQVKAVNGISFEICQRETFGLVGESGSGKSTIGNALLRLVNIDSGSIRLEGKPVHELKGRMLDFRRDLQAVFQDPYSSLNPSMIVADIIGEPLTIHYGLRGAERNKRVSGLLERVGMASDQLERYPSEFSGGQRQRIAIARALALEPKLIICDEPVSALDVSTQSQVISLLEQLQETMGISYLFIAHDLAVVRHISDRIGVLYLGQLMEVGPADRIYDTPAHPYTQMLLAAIPVVDPAVQRERKQERRKLPVTELPSPTDLPDGCPFHTRCIHVMDICRKKVPRKIPVAGGGWAACHLYDG
ncbi:MAG: ABC transporter ATP-binding protein [Pseudomonadales bacterium]